VRAERAHEPVGTGACSGFELALLGGAFGRLCESIRVICSRMLSSALLVAIAITSVTNLSEEPALMTDDQTTPGGTQRNNAM
jgi:hypothetical protein